MFSVSIQKGGTLIAAGVGEADVPDLCGMAALVAEVARRAGKNRALLDLLAVRPSLSQAQHIELGNRIAAILAGLHVAVVVPDAERVSSGERAAQQSGLALKTFTSLAEAEDWLATHGRAT